MPWLGVVRTLILWVSAARGVLDDIPRDDGVVE